MAICPKPGAAGGDAALVVGALCPRGAAGRGAAAAVAVGEEIASYCAAGGFI